MYAVVIEGDVLFVDHDAVGVEVFCHARYEVFCFFGCVTLVGIPEVHVGVEGPGVSTILLDDVDLDLGDGWVAEFGQAEQPEGGPCAGAGGKFGTHFEVSVLLGEAVAVLVDGADEAGTPAVVFLPCFDAEDAVGDGEGEAGLGVGEAGVAEVAGIGGVGDPASARAPGGDVQRAVEFFGEGEAPAVEVKGWRGQFGHGGACVDLDGGDLVSGGVILDGGNAGAGFQRVAGVTAAVIEARDDGVRAFGHVGREGDGAFVFDAAGPARGGDGGRVVVLKGDAAVGGADVDEDGEVAVKRGGLPAVGERDSEAGTGGRLREPAGQDGEMSERLRQTARRRLPAGLR